VNTVQARLLAALYACMRPLARVLLRSGLTYKTFGEIAKRAFVHEALLERDAKGRATNISRIAVRTGLSRKEVRRVCEDTLSDPHESNLHVDHSGPPAKVLHAWHADAKFIDPSGTPLDLLFEHGKPSFVDLVRAVAGGVPPGAVRAELKRAGAIADLEDGRIRPTKRYFVPGDFDEKNITTVSGILFPMLSAVDHNSNPHRDSPGFIQRFAYSGKLAPADRLEFRAWSRAEASKFIEAMDDWIATHEYELEPGVVEEDEQIVGVGVFYYEGPVADKLPHQTNELKKKRARGALFFGSPKLF
jgi:hypothetical protein